MPIDAALIENLGWRQGSIFSLPASIPIVLAHRDGIAVPQYTIPDDCRLLLVSHDCDVVHRGVHEPRVEVCPAVRVDGGLDGNFTGTRNPRRLHIQLEIGGVFQAFELRAPTRFSLPREILQASTPDAEARIRPKHHEYFCHWLAKRVRRAALPTEFDRRVSPQIRTQMRNVLRPLSDRIDSILIALNPDGTELAPEVPYVAQIVALVDGADYADPLRRAAVDGAMHQIEELLDQCPGIELDACVSQSMAEMTLDVYRDFDLWDYDELSLDAGAEPPQPDP
jgi:hypothetical protein